MNRRGAVVVGLAVLAAATIVSASCAPEPPARRSPAASSGSLVSTAGPEDGEPTGSTEPAPPTAAVEPKPVGLSREIEAAVARKWGTRLAHVEVRRVRIFEDDVDVDEGIGTRDHWEYRGFYKLRSAQTKVWLVLSDSDETWYELRDALAPPYYETRGLSFDQMQRLAIMYGALHYRSLSTDQVESLIIAYSKRTRRPLGFLTQLTIWEQESGDGPLLSRWLINTKRGTFDPGDVWIASGFEDAWPDGYGDVLDSALVLDRGSGKVTFASDQPYEDGFY